MDLVQPTGSPRADGGLVADTRTAKAAVEAQRRAELAVDFEAAMLTSFVEPILPPEGSEMWGGPAGTAWRGLFAQEIAREIARAGGIGLADLVRPVLEMPANDNAAVETTR